jgi:hypothetical protein
VIAVVRPKEGAFILLGTTVSTEGRLSRRCQRNPTPASPRLGSLEVPPDVLVTAHLAEESTVRNLAPGHLDDGQPHRQPSSIGVEIGPPQTAKLRAAADSLKPIVVLKRVSAELGTLEYVDRDLRKAMVASRADLESVISAVAARVPTRPAISKAIRRVWKEVESDVLRGWETEWKSLAPGADVLDRIFMDEVGIHFQKRKHGVLLAGFIEPDPELSALVNDF